MTINEALKSIEFPVRHIYLWDIELQDWKSMQTNISNWNGFYNYLEVRDEEKTIIEFNPTQGFVKNSLFGESIEMRFAVGTPFNIYKYREECSKDSYAHWGNFNLLNFRPSNFLKVYIHYVDYERINV